MSPEQRDRAILDGAIAQARDDGLDSLTVRSVAARVGVTPALIAHYRPSMGAFVAEVFGAIVAAEREEVLAGFESGTVQRADLLRLVETLLDPARDDVTLIWVQAWALGTRNDDLAARVRHEMDLWQRALEDALTRSVSAGAIPALHAPSAAWLLLAMVDGMSAHSLVKWAPHDRADLARRALSAVLDRADPPAHPDES